MHDQFSLCGIVQHRPEEGRGMAAVIYACAAPDARLTIAHQVEVCSRYAERQAYHVVAKLSDLDCSAGDYQRPGIWTAIESLKPESVLVVCQLNLLAWTPHATDVIEQAVVDAGARIVSASGERDWPESEDSRWFRRLLRLRAIESRQARWYRRRYAKVARSARLQAPFGWRRDQDDPKTLAPVPAEQAVIRQIHSLHRTGLGLREIARELERSGAPRRGKRWHHSTVDRVLRRPERD